MLPEILFLVSEEESYNEAAQTLLAIGNLAQGATSAANYSTLEAGKSPVSRHSLDSYLFWLRSHVKGVKFDDVFTSRGSHCG